MPILDLNNEQTLWATFQGCLIFASAGLSLLIAARCRATQAARTALVARAWAACCSSSAADEIDRDSRPLPGRDRPSRQIVLLPVAIVGIVAWLKVLQRLSATAVARLSSSPAPPFWFVLPGDRRTVQADIPLDDHARGARRRRWARPVALRAARLAAVAAGGRLPAEADRRQLDRHATSTPLRQPASSARETPTG